MLKHRRTVVAWWGVFIFVAWNVVFDREVRLAGIEFTRAQVVRSQQGQAVSSIDDAFSPRVRSAAVKASGVAGAIAALGAVLLALTSTRPRRPTL